MRPGPSLEVLYLRVGVCVPAPTSTLTPAFTPTLTLGWGHPLVRWGHPRVSPSEACCGDTCWVGTTLGWGHPLVGDTPWLGGDTLTWTPRGGNTPWFGGGDTHGRIWVSAVECGMPQRINHTL